MKRLCSMFLVSLLLCGVFSAPSFGLEIEPYGNEVEPELALFQAYNENAESYDRFVGEVIGETQGDTRIIMLEDDEGNRAEFEITANTYMYDIKKFTAGETIACFYERQSSGDVETEETRHEAVVVASMTEGMRMFVGRFDEDLVSVDNFIKILGTESGDVEIISQDGEKYSGSLADKKLAVIYDIVGLSIPGITTPSRVIVLNEIDSTDASDISEMPILVNGTVVENYSAFTNENGTVMIPLKPVADILKISLIWEENTRTVNMGITMSMQIGKDEYIFARMAPIKLGDAPVLVNGRTYVPLKFFTDVARFGRCYISAGQIIINDYDEVE